ncbi:MAG: HK97 gp10 family phage protein [Selenomonadaceae bacterium]|nr:HK97 gp10 family phage protein [Selenomonadaceae bacterium]
MGEHVLKAAKVALKKGADAVVADAKNRCPVNTGRLRNSIKAESNRDGSVYWITANASVESKKSPSGRFYYGAVVEFSPKINRPFLYPAMEQNRQQIEDDISAAISKAARSG